MDTPSTLFSRARERSVMRPRAVARHRSRLTRSSWLRNSWGSMLPHVIRLEPDGSSQARRCPLISATRDPARRLARIERSPLGWSGQGRIAP